MLSGTVVERIFIGNAQRYRVSAAGGLEFKLRLAFSPGVPVFEPGQKIDFGWNPQDVHVIGSS